MMAMRKIHLYAAITGVLVAVALTMALAKPKGTAMPPPGPHKAGDVWIADLAGKTSMAMVWCPPGEFLFGNPAVTIEFGSNQTRQEIPQGFWLGKYEVTQGQWLALMGTCPSHFPDHTVVRRKIWKWEIPVWKRNALTNRWDFPVERVGWKECEEFCQRAGPGFRLPDEIEWEYACRAGSIGAYAGTGVLADMGWYSDPGRCKRSGSMCAYPRNDFQQNALVGEKTHPVGQKQPNAWGLYDMHGNVWERCLPMREYSSPWEYSSFCPASPHVLRGGAWDMPPSYCSSFDGVIDPANWRWDIGFRIVWSEEKSH